MKKIVDIMDSAIKKLNNVREKLHNNEANLMAINIIVDDSNPPRSMFVEIENDQGASIGIGEYTPTKHGFSKIRITASDIISHEQT